MMPDAIVAKDYELKDKQVYKSLHLRHHPK